MMKKLMMMSLLGMVCAAGMAQTDRQLFTSPFTTENGDKRPYRIPAIVQTSNDEILVIADKRYCGGDVGQISSTDARIDLVYRRWNGEDWEEEKTIVIGQDNFGYGDAAVVADREDPNNILIMCAAGNVFFTSSNSNSRLQCCRIRSTDGGKTWNTPDNVTEAIYKVANYNGVFFSSGRICQSSQIKVGTHYRLYAALCVTGTNSVVVYSDDFGENWYMLGSGVAVSGGNEAKCEELPNGNVLVSARESSAGFLSKAKRQFNVFTYTNKEKAEGQWGSKTAGITLANTNETNGEILIVPAVKASTQELCNILLQSVPYGSGSITNKDRKFVSIYYKELSADANTSYSSSNFSSGWTRYQVSDQTSAYSSMIWQADGNIGFVWEDYLQTLVKDGYNIEYKNLSLSTITGGAYTNIQPKTMSQVPASCTASWCNNASYSTLYLPYGVQLPEGVTAYTGTLEGNVLTIKAIESGVVPAYTAVLLEDTEKRSTINLTMVNTTAKITENDLQGTLTAIDGIDKSKYYVLGHGSSHIGFYHPNSTTLKANAAYIYVEDGAAALSIRREGATDIEEEEVAIDNEQTAIIYDLMGRRVENPTRGLYIINGKKVFVK